ncbi:MAG: hypothetical protein ACREM3_03230 [Candidatus Rokuibacteriota bacterium]
MTGNVRVLRALVLALSLGALAAPALAAEWGTIIPGTTTMEQVRAQYGGPTRTTTQKTDNYDTAQWTYEGARAPAGMIRMTVDFGLLSGSTYRAEVVRSFRLEPKPGVFTLPMITAGWGEPSHVSPRGQMPPRFFYESGLLVTFDEGARIAESMVFTPPQRLDPGPAPKPR